MNLPTKITVVRMLLIPIMVILFYLPFTYSALIAAVIFTVAAITDFLDGYLARKHNLVTSMGKFLDPIADKLLVITALCLILEASIMPLVFGAVCVSVIIARELIIGGLRQIAAAKNIIIAADMSGKIKAFFQDIATGILIALPTFKIIFANNIYKIFEISGLVLIAFATVLTVYSGISYIIKNKHALKDA